MKEEDELKKLDPQARLKKLKEIIEKKNQELTDKTKEIDEAKKLSEKAKHESDEIDDLKKKILVPEIDEVDITKLFEPEGDRLENRVKAASQKESIEQEVRQLYRISPQLPTQQIYADAKNLYNNALSQGMVTPAMAQDAANIQYVMAKKDEAMAAGIYSPTEEIVRQAETVKNMADRILSLYSGGVKKKDGI